MQSIRNGRIVSFGWPTFYKEGDHDLKVASRGFFGTGQPLIWFIRVKEGAKYWTSVSICSKTDDFFWLRGLTAARSYWPIQKVYEAASVPPKFQTGCGENVQRLKSSNGQYFFQYTHNPHPAAMLLEFPPFADANLEHARQRTSIWRIDTDGAAYLVDLQGHYCDHDFALSPRDDIAVTCPFENRNHALYFRFASGDSKLMNPQVGKQKYECLEIQWHPTEIMVQGVTRNGDVWIARPREDSFTLLKGVKVSPAGNLGVSLPRWSADGAYLLVPTDYFGFGREYGSFAFTTGFGNVLVNSKLRHLSKKHSFFCQSLSQAIEWCTHETSEAPMRRRVTNCSWQKRIQRRTSGQSLGSPISMMIRNTRAERSTQSMGGSRSNQSAFCTAITFDRIPHFRSCWLAAFAANIGLKQETSNML